MLLKTEHLGSLPSDKTKTVSQGETVVVPTKSTLEYAPLSRALEHKFGTLKKRELKRTGTVLWGLLGAYNEDGSLFVGVFGEGALTMSSVANSPVCGSARRHTRTRHFSRQRSGRG